MSDPVENAARRAGAVLTVDLGAIAANWRGLRDAGRAAGRPVDCAAVLKADAYGTGASVVGPRLAADGCRQFFVAQLEEGIALRAVDIDIIYINGYGYPAWRGGPMWYADTVGLKKVYERVKQFREEHGELWEPASLLKRLAEEGKTFADFDKQK